MAIEMVLAELDDASYGTYVNRVDGLPSHTMIRAADEQSSKPSRSFSTPMFLDAGQPVTRPTLGARSRRFGETPKKSPTRLAVL